MDVYVARQPIFDRRMNVLGYELLYRRSMNNFYEGTSDSQLATELLIMPFIHTFNELTSVPKHLLIFT